MIIKREDYEPFYKFGINALIKLLDGKEGTQKDPIVIKIEDPIFGRILRLLNNHNVNLDDVGRFDHHLYYRKGTINKYIRIECLGGRLPHQERFKGENER